jgi:CheY-like chemotaxis protein
MSAEHIMVVEDDRLVMSVVTSQLRAQNYEVTRAMNITDAMQAIRKQAPDLMILDLTLLDADPFSGLTDGFAFLTLLRRHHPEASFPVIIYSVDHSPRVQARAQALGACAVIEKGGPLGQLLDSVRTALDARPQPEAVVSPAP